MISEYIKKIEFRTLVSNNVLQNTKKMSKDIESKEVFAGLQARI